MEEAHDGDKFPPDESHCRFPPELWSRRCWLAEKKLGKKLANVTGETNEPKIQSINENSLIGTDNSGLCQP